MPSFKAMDRGTLVNGALRPGGGVSRLVLGGRFGERPFTLSRKMLDRFYAAGGRLVETASIYADGKGERELGAWLSGAPEDTVCITKVGHPAECSAEVDVESIRKELERSAERLRLTNLDVVLLHRDDPTKPVGALLEPLMSAVAEGALAAIGVANWRTQRLREAAVAARPVGGLAAASAQLSLAVPGTPLWPGTVHADAGLLDLHAELELPLLAWSANARGWFAGSLSREDCPDPAARRSFNTAENVRRLERCRALAEDLGVTATTTALAWTLRTVPLALAVIGPSNLTELDDAITAAHLYSSADELDELSTS